MTRFIQNIISRHLNPVANIRPRLTGKFESPGFNPAFTKETFAASPVIDQPVNTGPISTHTGMREKIMHSILPAVQQPGAILPAEKFQHTQTDPNEQLKSSEPAKNDTSGRIDNDRSAEIYNKDHEEREYIPGKDHTAKAGNTIIPEKIQPLIKALHVEEDPKNSTPGKPLFAKQGMHGFETTPGIFSSEIYQQQAMPAVIKVSIGRIEVRATTAANPAKINREPLQKPKMSLEEYLEKRNTRQ